MKQNIHQLPELDYPYDALEPYIDRQTMEIHHLKHHQAYVDNLNKALAEYSQLSQDDPEKLITDLSQVPEPIRQAVRNQGGGHVNHSFFWQILKKSNEVPENELTESLKNEFNSIESFKNVFIKKSAGVFGSGWGWLVNDQGKLKIITTANQDSPLSQKMAPVIGVDVWEHAYYLKYQNKRADYLNAFWQVINWEQANQNYLASL